MQTLPVPSGFVDESDAFLIREAILDELGQWSFDKLCQAFGGLQIDIPGRPTTITEDHDLAQVLGLDDARLLCEAVGPARYYVPQYRPADDRKDRLIDMVQRGFANWEISRALSLTERHVRRLLAQLGITNPNRKPRKLFSGSGGAVAAGGAA